MSGRPIQTVSEQFGVVLSLHFFCPFSFSCRHKSSCKRCPCCHADSRKSINQRQKSSSKAQNNAKREKGTWFYSRVGFFVIGINPSCMGSMLFDASDWELLGVPKSFVLISGTDSKEEEMGNKQQFSSVLGPAGEPWRPFTTILFSNWSIFSRGGFDRDNGNVRSCPDKNFFFYDQSLRDHNPRHTDPLKYQSSASFAAQTQCPPLSCTTLIFLFASEHSPPPFISSYSRQYKCKSKWKRLHCHQKSYRHQGNQRIIYSIFQTTQRHTWKMEQKVL